MPRQEALACVVAFWHELFGLPLAVTSLNRYSLFVEAAGRRLAWVMVSSYLLGTPFFDEKRQQMAASGTFLGLDFDLTDAMSAGEVTFFVREWLIRKVSDLVASFPEAQTLRAGLASKIYGMLSFLELGMFGRVGAGGLQAIKARQLQRGECLTPEHLVFLGGPQKWQSFVANVDAELYQLFQPGDHHIAQLELAMILYGLMARPSDFRGRRGVCSWITPRH